MKTDLAHFCDKLLWRYKLAWKSMNVTKFSDKGIFPNIVMCHQIQSEIVIFYLLFTHVRTWLKWILVFIQKKIRTFSHTTNIGRKTIATCYFYIFFLALIGVCILIGIKFKLFIDHVLCRWIIKVNISVQKFRSDGGNVSE